MDQELPFGYDPMDIYSVPVATRHTKLASFFDMPLRATAQKPRRALTVMWDGRKPLVPCFDNSYSYFVRFANEGGSAGNHYHKLKHELMYVLQGELTFILEDIRTKERETHTLHAKNNTFIYVRPHIAHAAISASPNNMLLVIGSAAGTVADEYNYRLTPLQKTHGGALTKKSQQTIQKADDRVDNSLEQVQDSFEQVNY